MPDMENLRIGTAFIPVSDLESAAKWYCQTFGFELHAVEPWGIDLRAGGSALLTLMGPASGTKATPGLAWATCNFAVGDIDRARAELQELDCEPSPIEGSLEVGRYFTVQDLDHNTLLVTDR